MARSKKVAPPSPKAYWCEACEKIFSVDEIDTGNKLYECRDHGIFARDDSLNGNHQCPDCSRYGSSVGKIACPEVCGNREGLEELFEEPVQCEECDEIFKDDEALLQHVSDEHGE